VFDYRRQDAPRPFTLDKGQLRKQARANGMCTRCVVRSALRGKAYCQRCTEYAKRYARKRNQRDSLTAMHCRDTHRDNVMRIADYRLADSDRALDPRQQAQRSHSFVKDPEQGPLPHRRDEHFADLTRARALGAAVILQNPIPTPVGLNPLYDEIYED
jgi:hypothetical protein